VYAPSTVDAMVKKANFRIAIACGIRNKGERDFGHFNYTLLDRVHSLCQEQGWGEQVPGYKPLWKQLTGEKFGVDHIEFHNAVTEVTLPPEEWVDELFGGLNGDWVVEVHDARINQELGMCNLMECNEDYLTQDC
jgi:hypothetical protein